MKRLLSFLIISAFFFACKSASETNGINFSKKIRSALYVNKVKLKKLDLKKYTSFAWSKVYIFEPYSSHFRIKTAIGSNVETDIEYYDNIFLLVFLFHKKVVANIDLPRNIVDFEFKQSSSMKVAQLGISKNKAIFEVIYPQDSSYLILRY